MRLSKPTLLLSLALTACLTACDSRNKAIGQSGKDDSITTGDTMAEASADHPASDHPTQTKKANSDTATTMIDSPIVGIWELDDEEEGEDEVGTSYYYQFTPTGEYIRTKLTGSYDEPTEGNKTFGTYTVEGHFLTITFMGDEMDKADFHLDDDDHVLVINFNSRGGSMAATYSFSRISQEDYDYVTRSITNWTY